MTGAGDEGAPRELTGVRRLEAAGFRAWPAAFLQYDGTWAVRLTAGLPAKRLNSVNPLDPADDAKLDDRIARAARLFASHGRPLTFRMTPLAAPRISHHLDGLGWSRFSPSLVMQAALDERLLRGALDQIPLKDVARYINAAVAVGSLDAALRRGMSDLIASIEPEAGLFVLEEHGEPVSTAICVRDRDLAGLFEVGTRESRRGRGLGRRLLLSALKWARVRGAQRAWLQVEADNEAALGLYRSMGFQELYGYHYRRPPEAGVP